MLKINGGINMSKTNLPTGGGYLHTMGQSLKNKGKNALIYVTTGAIMGAAAHQGIDRLIGANYESEPQKAVATPKPLTAERLGLEKDIEYAEISLDGQIRKMDYDPNTSNADFRKGVPMEPFNVVLTLKKQDDVYKVEKATKNGKQIEGLKGKVIPGEKPVAGTSDEYNLTIPFVNETKTE
ncbi:hypothetical protein GF323_02085 [Candidatus Woesearchaeota archaeon]|nr:hypothetical protein [Candidatus Woesearchaeota archaeon]